MDDAENDHERDAPRMRTRADSARENAGLPDSKGLASSNAGKTLQPHGIEASGSTMLEV